MGIAANSSIRLGASSPKKDAIVGVGDPVTGANEVSIWAETTINPNLTQSIVGDFTKLFRFAKTNIENIVGAVAMPLGGSDTSIKVDQVAAAGELRLEIGTDIIAGAKSHFLNRTFKRLIERWLEESK